MVDRFPRKKKIDLFHVLKIVIVILFVVLFIIVTVLSYRAGVLIFTDEGLTKEGETPVTFTLWVDQGDSTVKIGRILKENGIIPSAFVFVVQSKLYNCKIAPGVYTLSSADSSKAILKYLNEEYLKMISGE